MVTCPKQAQTEDLYSHGVSKEMNVPTDRAEKRNDRICMERQIVERRIKDVKNEIRKKETERHRLMNDNLRLGDQGCRPKEERLIWGGVESTSSLSTNEAFYLSMIVQLCIIEED